VPHVSRPLWKRREHVRQGADLRAQPANAVYPAPPRVLRRVGYAAAPTARHRPIAIAQQVKMQDLF